ncbi:TetR/AcrR family transcriptional regulator [Sulfurimonas sp. HSL-1656]|uniref:TetR/AcrR family transcriptional regulator n=1 Tax=Thiomicrolovo subterrani TaxID=3131934 RepID=UPI0031F83056
MKKSVMDAKKARLLALASTMLEQKGYQQLKVAELARAGSVSISTVYAIFGSKEGIYLAYIESKIAALLEAIDGIADEDPVLQLKQYAGFIFGTLEQGRIVLEEGVRNNPLFFNALSNEFSQSAKKIHSFLTACFAKINPGLEKEQTDLLVYIFSGQLHGYMQYWVVAGGNPLALAEQLCETFICQTKGCYPYAQGKDAEAKGGSDENRM